MKNNPFFKLYLFLILAVVGLILFALLSSYYSLPEIISIAPSNQSVNILDSTTLQIAFAKPPTSSQIKSLKLILSPPTLLSQSWEGSLLTATPLAPLLPHTLYTATLTYRGKTLLTTTFTTNRYSTEELKLQAIQQIQDDKTFADQEKAFYQELPWLRSLPLETNSYRVIYDYQTKKLRIRLLNGNTAVILPQIIAHLKSLAVDAEAIGYDLVY